MIKCHHRPEAEYEFTGEFLGLSHELKFAGKNLRELRETGCSIYGIYQDEYGGNDSNLLIVFYVQIMPDDFVMQLHRF